MKYVIIGDVHGRTNWKQIIEKESDADKFIFLGDYFDPYDWTLSLEDLINNFENILKFKLDNLDKVVLLIGNHDLAAFESQANKCRYVDGLYENLRRVFYNGIISNVFQLCYFINDSIICSHAGFSKTWLSKGNLKLKESDLNDDFKNCLLDEDLIEHYDFNHGDGTIWPDSSGDNSWQSPLWIRVPSLMHDKPDEIIQCIGHSRINKFANTLDFLNSKGILLCDCLEHDKYHTFENGEFKFKNIND
jgi:hypothetical protein